MLRKTIIALAAVAAVLTTLAPTTADAGWRHRHFHRHGWGWVGPAVVAGAIVTGAVIASAPRCYRRVWVATPYGPRKVRVFVC